MRNLKKILALALVFAMAFTFTAGAADFTDAAEINAKYADDVNMLVELGVIAGYPDGSFGPQKNITRAEFAKMAYTLKYGSDANGDLFAAQKSAFTDVEGNANVAWAKGYINYCANQKIVSGVGNNKFNPQGNITVAEAAKMILVILGCDPAKEGFTGANWAANVTSKAIDLGVFDGWTGDPMALATRELVAKLMRNAVFAPVYTYSTITGEGSQMNVFQNEENITLGEKTMGLLCETGIVVANENYALTTDEEGEPLWTVENEGQQDEYVVGVVPAATGEDSDESQIYYTYKTTAGNEVANLLTIPVALDDTLLGAEVTVFFKADEYSERAYKNVELIGNVMVTADTVIYDVPAICVDAYPNGKSKSVAAIAPYLAFDVDGKEVQVKAPAGTAKVSKNVDFQELPAIATAFGAISYTNDVALTGTTVTPGTLANAPAYDDAFFTDMGTPVLSNYRFVSVDGGKTYSYIFKMVNDDNTNIKYGAVSSYSEAKGTITVEGIRFFLDEVNLIGDIDADSNVVWYYENGIVNIEAVEVVTGEVEALNDDGSAVINGEAYYLWEGADLEDSTATTLVEYYTDNASAIEEGTTYYVYNGIVLDLEATETVSVTADYALILGSSYDEKTDTAYVTLAFADNTEATYEVGKLNLEKRNEPYFEDNDIAADFAFNKYFGMLVNYKIMDNGKVDLSANDLARIADEAQSTNKETFAGDKITFYSSALDSTNANSGLVKAYEGVLDFGGSRKYAASDDAVIFVIYGEPQHVDKQLGYFDYSIDRDGYKPVKAVAYKFVDKKDQNLGSIAQLAVEDAVESTVTAFSYAVNSTKSASAGIVAAAMTINMDADTGLAGDTDDLAYIVKAVRKYNVATQDYYLQMTLIGDDGLFVANTVDGVPGAGNASNRDLKGDIGEVKAGDTSDAAEFVAGFVTYQLNADGDISTMDAAMDVEDTVTFTNDVADEGLYLVNVVSERNGGLFFIDANADYDGADNVKNAPQSLVKFAEDGYKVVTIDADEYAGEVIIKVANKETKLDDQIGNAVIQVNDEGEIARVFAFVEGAVLADLNA